LQPNSAESDWAWSRSAAGKLARALRKRLEDRLVSEVHAVEIANGRHAAPVLRAQIMLSANE